MINLDNYIVWAIAAGSLLCIFLVWKLISRKRRDSSTSRFIQETLRQAAEQNQTFAIRLVSGNARTGLSATLSALSASDIKMQAQGLVTEEWQNKEVEVFFRVMQDGSPVSFVFNSQICKIDTQANESGLVLTLPQHLRVEKKRHFDRIQPDHKDVLMLAVWPAVPGKRLPRANSDLGHPAVSWKNGQPNPSVQLENIAGSGLALRLLPGKDGKFPLQPTKGKHLICLVVFKENDKDKVIFWCTGEVMNIRKDGYAMAVGLEFINWAVQEQGEAEIRWTHNSPWRGVKPILQWVQRLEKAR